RDFRGKIALGDGRGHACDVTDLVSQVAGHGVDRFGQILPGTRHPLDLRLTSELSFRSDFARHARHFRCESVELVHHDVDGVLELHYSALLRYRDFRGKIALGDGRGHTCDVTDLIGQVAGHRVDVVGKILP